MFNHIKKKGNYSIESLIKICSLLCFRYIWCLKNLPPKFQVRCFGDKTFRTNCFLPFFWMPTPLWFVSDPTISKLTAGLFHKVLRSLSSIWTIYNRASSFRVGYCILQHYQLLKCSVISLDIQTDVYTKHSIVWNSFQHLAYVTGHFLQFHYLANNLIFLILHKYYSLILPK